MFVWKHYQRGTKAGPHLRLQWRAVHTTDGTHLFKSPQLRPGNGNLHQP